MRNVEQIVLSPATRTIFEELPRRLYGSLYGGERAPDGLPFFIVRDGGGEVLARAAIWTNPEVFYRGETPGLIGSFECVDDLSCAESVLKAAEASIRAAGFQRVVGPMNGTTWAPYRLALPEGAPCRFPLEPMNPAYYCGLWEALGYEVIVNYISSCFPIGPDSFSRLEKAERIMAKRGITIYDFRPDCLEDDLNAIYDVSVVSFRNNFVYAPITREAFFAQYRPIVSRLRPHDASIARRADGTPVGFVFGFPNPYASSGEEYVFKTIAVLPDSDCRGLGGLLVERMAKATYDDGFKFAYHALMHEDNISSNIGNHAHAEVCRRYRLYAKELG